MAFSDALSVKTSWNCFHLYTSVAISSFSSNVLIWLQKGDNVKKFREEVSDTDHAVTLTLIVPFHKRPPNVDILAYDHSDLVCHTIRNKELHCGARLSFLELFYISTRKSSIKVRDSSGFICHVKHPCCYFSLVLPLGSSGQSLPSIGHQAPPAPPPISIRNDGYFQPSLNSANALSAGQSIPQFIPSDGTVLKAWLRCISGWVGGVPCL